MNETSIKFKNVLFVVVIFFIFAVYFGYQRDCQRKIEKLCRNGKFHFRKFNFFSPKIIRFQRKFQILCSHMSNDGFFSLPISASETKNKNKVIRQGNQILIFFPSFFFCMIYQDKWKNND